MSINIVSFLPWCISESQTSHPAIDSGGANAGSLNVEWTSAGRTFVMNIFRKHFDEKGIQVFFAISFNVHAEVRVGMQEGWQILGV